MRSLKVQFLAVLIGVVLIISLVSAVSYYRQSVANIKSNAEVLAENNLIQVDKNVTQYFADIQNLILPIYINDDIQRLLGGGGDIRSAVGARLYLSKLIDSNFLLYDVAVLGPNWSKLAGVSGMLDQQKLYNTLRDQYIAGGERSGWFGPLKVVGEDALPKQCYAFVNVLRNAVNYDQRQGYLCVLIDEGRLSGSFKYMAGDEGSIGIVDRGGKVFSSSDPGALGMTAMDLLSGYGVRDASVPGARWFGDKLVTVYPSVSEPGAFRFYSVLDMNDFRQERRIFVNNIALVGCLSVLIAIATGALLVSRILRPLARLRRNMRRAEPGIDQEPVRVTGGGEIAQLTMAYNDMTERIRALMADVRKLEREKMASELYVLQTQINPHFVFNTLVTIRLLAERFGENELGELIAHFSQVLRTSIQIGRQFVTIREELNCLLSFCAIQQLRYDHRITVIVDVPESLMDLSILKFVLQTPLENAIVHGLGERDGDGHIWIRCGREGGLLEFSVRDDGVGFSQSKLLEVRELLDSERFEGFQHSIGLLNLQKRIHMYYGESYRVRVENANPGAQVSFQIPDHPGGTPDAAFDC